MKYDHICEAVFLNRPNRFLAQVELDGRLEVAHVKNTGRCRELLLPGARVFVQEQDAPHRKTRFDLIGVYKGERLINMDSQAPNRVFSEWAQGGGFLPNIVRIKPEVRFGNSRFDFYIETDRRCALVEVKGVTLEEDGVARFPDAPTLRGVKHLEELCGALRQGYDAYAVFLIQMGGVKHFAPNDETHPAFGAALRRAAAQGVHILAMDCAVTPNSIVAGAPVPVVLS